MINEGINLLEKYCDGKRNIDKVEISVLQLHRIIKALEQQTCEDAVNRQAVIDTIAEFLYYPNDWNGMRAGYDLSDWEWKIKGVLSDVPSVKPQYTEDEIQKMQDLEQAEIEKAYELGKTEGQKTGHWIYDRTRDWDGECKYECSECGMGSDVDYPYCMRCGAKMIEPQESEDNE